MVIFAPDFLAPKFRDKIFRADCEKWGKFGKKWAFLTVIKFKPFGMITWPNSSRD